MFGPDGVRSSSELTAAHIGVLSDDLTAEELGRALDDTEGVAQFEASIERLGGGLSRRRACEWFVSRWTSLGGTDWLGTELVWPDGPDESVVIGVRVRAWTPTPVRVPSNRLWRIEVYVEVPCECDRDHGNHPVDLRSFEGSDVPAFDRASTDVLQQVDRWMIRGSAAEAWRQWAGLPGRTRRG